MSIFFIVGAVFVYRAQRRRLQKADPSEAQVSTGNKIKRIEE
jgi:cbb3-type cytochrome oxidase subunit 3